MKEPELDFEVQEWLRNAPPKYLKCRRRHSWDDDSGGEDAGPDWAQVNDERYGKLWVATTPCTRCGMKRQERYRVRPFESVGARYIDIPEGFHVPPGHGRLPRIEVVRYQIQLQTKNMRSAGTRRERKGV